MDYLPFARPTIDEAMIAAVADTLRSRWITTGPHVAAFEQALSERFGGRPVRALTSATAAMQVALEVLGVGPGDEVITPAQSFFATANVIERSGATHGVRGRGPAHAQPRPRRRPRRRSRRARACCCPPTTTRRSIRTPSASSRGATACAWSRTRRSRSARTRAGGPSGATGDLVVVQLPPEQEHHHHRGRRAGAERRGARPRASRRCASTASAGWPTARATSIAPAASTTSRTCPRAWASSSWRTSTSGAARASASRTTISSCLEGDDLLTPERLPPRDNPGHSWNMFTVLLPLEAFGRSRKAFIDAMHRRRHRHRRLLRGDPPHHALPRQGLPRGRCSRSPSASRARRSRCRSSPRCARPTSSACARRSGACCAARRPEHGRRPAALGRDPGLQRGGGAARALRAPLSGARRARRDLRGASSSTTAAATARRRCCASSSSSAPT